MTQDGGRPNACGPGVLKSRLPSGGSYSQQAYAKHELHWLLLLLNDFFFLIIIFQNSRNVFLSKLGHLQTTTSKQGICLKPVLFLGDVPVSVDH